jgi:hypothetical protein
MSADGPNDFLRKMMIDAAEARGWYVVGVGLESPGYVTVALVYRDTTVEIRSAHGLDNVRVISVLPDLRPEPKA